MSHYRTIHSICLLLTCRFCSALITDVILLYYCVANRDSGRFTEAASGDWK